MGKAARLKRLRREKETAEAELDEFEAIKKVINKPKSVRIPYVLTKGKFGRNKKRAELVKRARREFEDGPDGDMYDNEG